MTFTEKIEKLLAANHIKEVIDEFFKFLNEVPQSKTDARSDANQLRGQIIVLSGRFTELNTKINTNTVNAEAANQEKAAVINSFIQILNQLPSNYPDLNNYLQEKNEDNEWNDAQHKNTIDAYQIYFNKYPNGKYKADTIKLIAELEEVKLKQDTEIKRLALLEKERRANDKQANESQKVQPQVTSQPSDERVATTLSTSPAKSKKGLLIGIGVAVVAAIVIFLMMNKKSSNDAESETIDNENASTDSVAVEDYNIDGNSYYAIQNRSNSYLMAIAGGSNEDGASIVVTPEDSVYYDYQQFEVRGGNPYTIISKQSGQGIFIDAENSLNQTPIPDPILNSQLFKVTKFEDGYFQIEDNVEEGHVLGLDPASANFKKGQKIISMKNDNSPQTQWKLIPTGEKVIQ